MSQDIPFSQRFQYQLKSNSVTLKMGAVRLSETSWRTHYTTRRKTTEDHHLIPAWKHDSIFRSTFLPRRKHSVSVLHKSDAPVTEKIATWSYKETKPKKNLWWDVELLTTVQEVHIVTTVLWRNLEHPVTAVPVWHPSQSLSTELCGLFAATATQPQLLTHCCQQCCGSHLAGQLDAPGHH
jgi:hypothetical protein